MTQRCKVCGYANGLGPHAVGNYSHPFEPTDIDDYEVLLTHLAQDPANRLRHLLQDLQDVVDDHDVGEHLGPDPVVRRLSRLIRKYS